MKLLFPAYSPGESTHFGVLINCISPLLSRFLTFSLLYVYSLSAWPRGDPPIQKNSGNTRPAGAVPDFSFLASYRREFVASMSFRNWVIAYTCIRNATRKNNNRENGRIIGDSGRPK